jgi:hypothetical protein
VGELAVSASSILRRGIFACTSCAVVASTSAPALAAQTSAPAADSGAAPPARSMSWTLRSTIEPPFAVVDQRFADLDGRPGKEMCVLGADGEVRVAHRTEGKRGLAPELAGELVLPEPSRSLVSLSRVSPGAGPSELLVASPRGVELFRPDAHGVLGREPVPLLPRARFKLRVGVPRFADVVQDVNGDALSDLVLPNGDKLDLWIQQPSNATRSGNAPQSGTADGSSATPTFKRAASVHVQITSGNATENDELSRVLVSEFAIPRLLMLDVNGDGRPDLCVKDGDVRSFHIVAPDGSIPEKPDVSVDLSIFRDTTPEAGIRVGRTLPGGDKAHYESRDLDADGIPDYVIAHRRKVWVFHGTKKGPQFTEPSTILKADDDVTALLLADLDGDKYPDLVLFKVQVPSLAAILRGLLREWEVEIDAAGYRNLQGRTFDTKPAWKSALYLRLPAILSMVRDPQSLIHRFEEVGRKFRAPTEGDFDGDGKSDVALASEDSSSLDVWGGRAGAAKSADETNEALLRKVVFDDPERTWDIDRVISFMGGYAERRAALITGGRPADARIALRDTSEFDLSGVYAADVDGDGKVEIIVRYVRHASGAVSYDVWGAD